MNSRPSSSSLPDTIDRGPHSVRLTVSTKIYSRRALLRTCYLFTDRCYLFLEELGKQQVVVEIRSQQKGGEIDSLVGEFMNELINQRVRDDVAEETRAIRELIVAQAFAEADFEEDDPASF